MKKLTNLLLTLAAIVVVLLLAELALYLHDRFFRVAHADCYESSPYPDLPHLVKANYKGRGFFSNSQHLRNAEIPLTKPAHTFRLAVVGNSVTIAHQVKQNQTFTTLLEKELNARYAEHPHVDVINAGQEGYNIVSFRPFTNHLVYPYQPDVILYQFCWNDIETSSAGWVSRAPDRLPRNRFIAFLLRHSKLAHLLFKLSDVRLFINIQMGYYKVPEYRNAFYSDLQAWAQDVEQHQVRFILLFVPSVLEIQEPLKFPEVTEQMRQRKSELLAFCQANNIEVVDLTTAFLDYYAREKTSLFFDLQHLKPAGHRAVAQALAQLPWVGSDPH